MESQIRIAYGIAHVLICVVLVNGCGDGNGSAPVVNGSRSDISVRVVDGDALVLQCMANYPIKWIRLLQKDTTPISYQLFHLSNDTTASTSEQKISPSNFTSTLQITQILDDPHAITVFSCIAADSLAKLSGAFPSSALDDVKITKVHICVKKVSKPAEALAATLPDPSILKEVVGPSNDKCFPPTHKKSLTAEALLQTLNGDLLASKSATMTLEKWCGDHKLAPIPKIVAKRMHIHQTPPPLPHVARVLLRLNSNESVRYRSVELSCGERVLSVADNWYVPDRLTPEMNEQLDTTDIPFGKVVAPLQPFRQTSSVHFLWRPLPVGWEMNCPVSGLADDAFGIPHRVLEHQAVVCTVDGLPISFVDERYTKSMFDFL